MAPPATGSCYRRFVDGLQNAEIAFQSPWYKFETPCPLVRPSQTHLWRSARAPVDRGPWVFGEGVVGSDHPGNRVPAPPGTHLTPKRISLGQLYSEGAWGTPSGTRRARGKLISVFSCNMAMFATLFPSLAPPRNAKVGRAGPMKAAKMGG